MSSNIADLENQIRNVVGNALDRAAQYSWCQWTLNDEMAYRYIAIINDYMSFYFLKWRFLLKKKKKRKAFF